jgi:iron only hydrogenase large subunit-like protein
VTVYDGTGSVANAEDPHTPSVHKSLPMMASSCPGWVCYAEKTSQGALPYIATTKSPQQVQAVIII